MLSSCYERERGNELTDPGARAPPPAMERGGAADDLHLVVRDRAPRLLRRCARLARQPHHRDSRLSRLSLFALMLFRLIERIDAALVARNRRLATLYALAATAHAARRRGGAARRQSAYHPGGVGRGRGHIRRLQTPRSEERAHMPIRSCTGDTDARLAGDPWRGRTGGDVCWPRSLRTSPSQSPTGG